MILNLSRIVLVAAAVIGAAFTSTPAAAGTGCNGVVNWFVWGCAGWDNNNGPQFPYYRKKTVVVPKADARLEVKNGTTFVVSHGQYMPLITNDGGSFTALASGN